MAASRFVTVDEEVDLENDVPLLGVNEAEDLTLEKALLLGREASGLTGDGLKTCLNSARSKARKVLKKGPDHLNEDEIGAIFLYTLESPLYKNLNKLLRQRQRKGLKTLFPYLKLLLTALHKLPPCRLTVFRGVKADLAGKYTKNDEVVWWGFSSTTSTQDVLMDDQFLGTSGPRTLFFIETSRAVDIRKYSSYGDQEDERLLMPGMQFTVKSKMPNADGLLMVQLVELPDQPTLLAGFDFAAAAAAPAEPPTTSQTLACVEETRGWDAAREELRRTNPDWGQLVAHCRQLSGSDARCQYVLGMCYLTGDGAAKDEGEAARLLRLAAAQGYAPAQAALARLLLLDAPPESALGEAIQLLRQAADKGSVPAQCDLGKCYLQGTGVAKDMKQAVRYLRGAAEAADADAQFHLGVCYNRGYGLKQDYVEALRWYRKSAAAGRDEANNNLGVIFRDGLGVKQDHHEAVRAFKVAAEAGCPAAQYNLGLCYYAGLGVRQDPQEAVQWFRPAAEAGDKDAQSQLGQCCYLGVGVQQDYAEAVRWFRGVVDDGYPEAQHSLGACYYAGLGVRQDFAEAVRWFRVAAAAGNRDAQAMLGGCHLYGQGVPQNYEEGLRWSRVAAEAGQPLAQHNLAACYYAGQGVRQDLKEAAHWYRRAADAGVVESQAMLGRCYAYGHGAPRDLACAVHWCQLAASAGHDGAKATLAQLRQPTRADGRRPPAGPEPRPPEELGSINDYRAKIFG
eukprot:EG_transcript_2542